ncbi:MAG TPA: hypothetical protein ENK27_03740 [Desulfobulbus sp.]|nr:hypothetical protein [Desulfobulbus sp.]
MQPIIQRTRIFAILSAICLLFSVAVPARAALDGDAFTTQLNNLVLQGNDLLAQASTLALNPLTMNSQIDQLESAVTDYQSNVIAAYNDVVTESGSSLSLSSDMLVALQTLSTISLSLANTCKDLTVQIANLAATTVLSGLDSALSAMLRLSDDIGLMADRILEMADKILVMADNIGEMADRIIATQLIQSNNLKLIRDAILETQNNIIRLIGLFL